MSAPLYGRVPDDSPRSPIEPRRLSWGETHVIALVALHCAFPAWPLGGMTAWGQWLSLATGLLAAAAALRPRARDEEELATVGPWQAVLRSPAVWAGAALLGYVAIQAMNPAWRYAVDDEHWWLEPSEHVAWLPAGMDTPYLISSPWRSLVILAGAWLGVVAIVAGVTRRRAARVLLTLIVLNATAVALLGLAQQLTKAPGMYWSYVPPDNAGWFGPFIYRNHAAAFLAPGLAAAMALAIFHRRRTQRRMDRSGPGPVFALLAVFIGLGAVFTFSRAGAALALALLGGVALWRAIVWWCRPHSRSGVAGGLALTLLLAGTAGYGVSTFDLDHLRERFSELPETSVEFTEDRRFVAYRAAFDMFADRPLLGWGAGSFRFYFPVYQQNYPTIHDTVRIAQADGTTSESKLADPLYWEHAHNDLLEFPVELGVIGTALLLAGPLSWLARCLRARVWQYAPGMILLAGLVATLLHAGVDFVFQNPAVLILWSALWPLLERWLPPPRANEPTVAPTPE